MVTIQEFEAMSPTERQTTIENLMATDPQNAQILMIRQQELAGLNTGTPTTAINPVQAEQIKETQAYNEQVYEQYLASQLTSPQPQPSDYWTRDLTQPTDTTKSIINPTTAINLTPPKGQEMIPGSLSVTESTVEYMTRPITQSPPAQPKIDLLGSIAGYASNPLGVSSGFLPGLAELKHDPIKHTINFSLKIGGLVSLGAAPAVAGVGAVVSPFISQGLKSAQGGGLLTLKEFEESFFGGAAFSVASVGANQVLGFGVSGVKAVVGRVGVNTGLGAGMGTVYEFAENKQVTGKGALEGAVFGATLGLTGEAVGFTGAKINTKLKSDLVSSYQKSVQTNQIWKPTFSDRTAMLFTRKVPNIVNTPNIKTNGNIGSLRKSGLKMVNDVGPASKLPYNASPKRIIGSSSEGLEPGRFRESTYRRAIDIDVFQSWRKTVKPYYGEKVNPASKTNDPFEISVKINRDSFIGLKNKDMIQQAQMETQTKRVSKPYKNYDAEGHSQVQKLLDKGMFREAELTIYKRGLNMEIPKDAHITYGQRSINKSTKSKGLGSYGGTQVIGGLKIIGSTPKRDTEQISKTKIGFTTKPNPIPNNDPVNIVNIKHRQSGGPSILPSPRGAPTPEPSPFPSPFPSPNKTPHPDVYNFPTVLTSTAPRVQSQRISFRLKTPLSGFGGGRGGGSKFGKWYYRKHPIPSATQQLKQLTGKRVRGPNYSKSKRKSKRKR